MIAAARDDPFISTLGDAFVQALRDLLPAGEEVVLTDLPFHTNVGDHAILCGELAALRALGHQVGHVPVAPYDRDAFRARAGGRPILLHGGGNLGDVWPAHQRLRERLIEDFTGQPILQLPQSVSFSSAAALDRARAVFTSHPALTIMVRDHASLEIAEAQLGTAAILTPDAAMALGPIARPSPPAHDVVVLARTDHEAVDARALPSGASSVDWIEAPADRTATALSRVASLVDRRAPARVGAVTGRATLRAWEAFAGRHVDRGLAMLSSGRVVVTDRLHAHLLALLLGIPNVVSDNANGKIRGYYEAWTHESPLVAWAGSLAEAREMGLGLARGLDATS